MGGPWCARYTVNLRMLEDKVAVNVKLLKEEYQRLIIIAKVSLMCYKTKLKLMGVSRECIFKTTCALSTVSDYLNEVFIK